MRNDSSTSPAMGTASASGTHRRLITAALILALLVAIFARLMNFDMRKDEELYLPPARLLADHTLYADFFYNHVPGSAWLFRGLYLLTGSDHLLLAGRLGTLGLWLIFAAAVAGVTIVLTRSWAATALAATLVLANDLLLGQAGMAATNNLLPLPLAYLGMALFLFAVMGGRSRFLLCILSGLLLGLAASVKISFAAFIPPVAVAAFLLPREASLGERIRTLAVPLAVGGILGSLPVFYYLATDPERFLADVIGFHRGPHLAYWRSQVQADEEAALSLGDKAKLAHSIWFGGANLLLVFATLLVIVQAAFAEGRKATMSLLSRGPSLLLLAWLCLAAIFSFVPTPSFPQYFAPPLICLLLLFAYLYGSLAPESRSRLAPAWLAAAVLVLFVNAPRLLESLPKLAAPRQWTVMRVHENGKRIAEAMTAAGASGKVATLLPVYPLEAHLPVYLELATGPFAYRSAEFAPDDLRALYRTTSPAAVGELLKADPPGAILVGFDAQLEAPLIRFAETNGYRRLPDFTFNDRYGAATLYVKPIAP